MGDQMRPAKQERTQEDLADLCIRLHYVEKIRPVDFNEFAGLAGITPDRLRRPERISSSPLNSPGRYKVTMGSLTESPDRLTISILPWIRTNTALRASP